MREMVSPLPGGERGETPQAAEPGGRMSAIRVFLVDDSPEFVQFTKDLLAELTEFQVVGSAHSAEDALASIEQLRPDLVLMDWTMEGMSGLEATRRLKSRPLAPRGVLVTGSGTPEYRRAAPPAPAAGC